MKYRLKFSTSSYGYYLSGYDEKLIYRFKVSPFSVFGPIVMGLGILFQVIATQTDKSVWSALTIGNFVLLWGFTMLLFHFMGESDTLTSVKLYLLTREKKETWKTKYGG